MKLRAGSLALVVALATRVASADDADDKRRAAVAFDEGVERFRKSEYREAAAAFLAADQLAPNEEALKNAVASARRANDHLVAARAAERALARGLDAPWAREALSEASRKLASLDVRCAADACSITIDDEAAAPGVRLVLPGTHVLRARAGDATAEERASCDAGATCAFRLAPRAKTIAEPRAFAPVAGARGLHPAFFVALAGATVALGAVTTWSGADAIHAKNALPPEPEQAAEDDVRARARRTDVLLAATGVAALGAIVVGAAFTRWSAPAVKLAVRGASLSAEGTF